jgi:hypothetical protein
LPGEPDAGLEGPAGLKTLEKIGPLAVSSARLQTPSLHGHSSETKANWCHPVMTKQHRIAVAVITALILASFVQGIIMCAEVGLGSGWLLIRNDPGKFIFHLLLLPVSFGALVWSFPTALARRCLDTRGTTRYALLVVAAALVLLAIAVGGQETVDGFKKRIPVPTDVRAVVMREGGIRSARSDLLVAWLQFHDTAWVPDSRSSASTSSYSRERAAAYDGALRAVLGPSRDFWKQASVGAWWSGFLSILGVWFIGAWILTIIIVALQHRLLDEQTTGALVVAFCTGLASAGVWFYFKIYSEWYINFYTVPSVSLAPLIMTLLAALVLALTAVLVQHAQQPLAWFGRFAAVGGFATGLAAYWKPELLRAIADAYRQANDPSVVGLWTVAAVTAFVAAYLTAAGAESPPSDGSVTKGTERPVERA